MTKCRTFCLLAAVLIAAAAPEVSSMSSSADDGYFADSIAYMNNLCYHRNGKAKFCQPQFENLAVNKRVTATSTCGSPPVRVCRREGAGHHCELCDSSQTKLSHPASHLTDYHVHGSCWVSEPLRPNLTSVNLTISFHKKHTVYYMSITGCGVEIPDAIEVFKSADYGATWQLWHLFSNNCTRDYGKRGYSYQFRETIQPKEVICSDINLITNINDISGSQLQQPVLSFSTNFNRYSTNGNYEKDPVIIDWMLATDMRLVLRRHPLKNGSVYAQPFAFSNLDIGGRCFCNGHASRCVVKSGSGSGSIGGVGGIGGLMDSGSSSGSAVCECAHGTEGDDCERCKQFWVDLPWKRGTLSDPSECKRCDCNSHTDQCHFDVAVYKSSTTTGTGDEAPNSGGVCLGCKHNTAGKRCHYCRPGFHRNWGVSPDNPRVCTLCNCHPLGSSTNTCDRSTGRCVCKDGVDGDKCDRCKSGYEQTNDPAVPCRRIGEIWHPPPPPVIRPQPPPPGPPPHHPDAPSEGRPREVDGSIKPGKKCPANCKSDDRRLTQTDYCLRHWAISAEVTSVRRQRRWVQVKAIVQLAFKCPKNCLGLTKIVTFWVKRRHWRCRCPRLQRGVTYLIITRDKRHRKHATDLILDKRSIVWRWENNLRMKIQRYENFVGYYSRDDGCTNCDCVRRRHRLDRQLQQQQMRNKRRRKTPRMRRRDSAAAAAATSATPMANPAREQPHSGYLYGGTA